MARNVCLWRDPAGGASRRLAAFLTLFGILASHTVLETARDALFLARLPASQLPWVYLAMAAVAVAMAQVPARGLRELLGRYGLAASLALDGRGHARASGRCRACARDWGLRALYVWSGLVGTLAALQFWLALGEIVTITQAKRLYRFVGTGSLLGAVAGALLARLVSTAARRPQALIPTAALLMALHRARAGALLPRAGAARQGRGRAAALDAGARPAS